MADEVINGLTPQGSSPMSQISYHGEEVRTEYSYHGGKSRFSYIRLSGWKTESSRPPGCERESGQYKQRITRIIRHLTSNQCILDKNKIKLSLRGKVIRSDKGAM